MKLRELLKEFYGSVKEVNMGSSDILNKTYKQLILPGTFNNISLYKKTIAWNLDRDVYYREATKEGTSDELYVTVTTGKMDFYLTFENDDKFIKLLEDGLKKHRSYRRESLSWSPDRKYLYYSRKYE